MPAFEDHCVKFEEFIRYFEHSLNYNYFVVFNRVIPMIRQWLYVGRYFSK